MSTTPESSADADELAETVDDSALRESDPNAGSPERLAGDMGLSSETVGPTGPGQVGTDGVRVTTPPADVSEDASDGDSEDDADPGASEPSPA